MVSFADRSAIVHEVAAELLRLNPESTLDDVMGIHSICCAVGYATAAATPGEHSLPGVGAGEELAWIRMNLVHGSLHSTMVNVLDYATRVGEAMHLQP